MIDIGMKGNPMARSMLGMAFCGLIFAAGISWGQNDACLLADSESRATGNAAEYGQSAGQSAEQSQGNQLSGGDATEQSAQ